MVNSPPLPVASNADDVGFPRRAPWDAPDLFPPKPEDADYGWRSDGKSHACSRDELIERCRSTGREFVDLVWTPESPRHVPPAEVQWLIEPLRQRARADLRHNLRVDITVLALGIGYVWYSIWYHRQFGQPGSPISPIFLAMFLLFAIVPTIQDIWALSRLRRSFAYLAEQAASLRYGVWLGGRRIVATYFVAGALIAVWAAQLVVGLGQSIDAAGLQKVRVRAAGEWERLLTAEMLHGHWMHFALNLMSLLAVGRLLEVHASPVYLPTVFLLSALSASVASLYLSPAVTSVGASGAIMGMVGFLAVLAYRRRHVLPRGFMKSISLSIALTAGAGLVAHEVVDNAAHFGGLLGGALLGLIYLGRRNSAEDGAFRLRPSTPARIAGWISSIIIAVVTFVTIWFVLQARLREV